MEILHGNAVVGQSGGPTAAINATLAGVIRGALDEIAKEGGAAITHLYGMRNGVDGLLREDIVVLDELFAPDADGKCTALDRLTLTPAAALGSCRKKLPAAGAVGEAETMDRLFAIFAKYDIRYFFYIGGNDSMDTVAKLTEYLKTSDYEMRVMGVPKTIDNDLAGTDHTPGFGSAAKYIASTMQEIVRDCAVYTTKAVTIVEIMGRDAGWLTASAGLANLVNGNGPDYLYLPEVAFDLDAFFADIEKAFEKHPNIVIGVSEGIRFADGRYVGEGAQSGSTDAFGHKYLSGTGKELEYAVKDKFGCKVRSIELNLPQRCAAHLASDTDLTESQTCGGTAMDAAVSGKTGCMVAMIREDGEEYRLRYETSEIAKIANAVRSVPREFINEAGNNVTDECLKWILPLIQGGADIVYENGLPVHFVIA